LIQTDTGSFGSTSLKQVANEYFLYNSGGTGPSLKYFGGPVVLGQAGAWSPIGAVQTATGYDVAWKEAGANQYSVWATDSNGNYLSNVITPESGSSFSLQQIETTFNQDLNGDGTVGPAVTLIQTDTGSFGSTSLKQVANEYFLYNSGGTGPSLKYFGSPVVLGQAGAWSPIGAVQTATGYDVAWKVAGADQYSVWATDSNGNYLSNVITPESGSSFSLQQIETTFNQDLNGDGTVGPPVVVGAGATVELSTPYTGPATFTGSSGTLKLDNPTSFSGTVAGMSSQDTLDLVGINFSTLQQPTFSGTASGGTLSVTDGTHSASIALLGNYMASTFATSSDGQGGTSIVDSSLVGSLYPLAPPQHA
jgi:hypothetical protein